MRLDVYLAQQNPQYSRSTWAKLIQRGDVAVNGETVKSTKRSVKDTDEVTVRKPANKKINLDLPIIYEDDNVVAIDKPAGVLTHAKGALSEESTVSDFIKQRAKSPTDNNRFGIVHRLDRATSGVIIGAKTPEALTILQKQFKNRSVKKTYLAVVNITTKGQKTLDQNGAKFIIDLPIVRNPKKPSQFRVGARGKSALTEVKVIKSTDDLALLELRPQTGRTHQLRVHLAYIGLPIVGDNIYGSKNRSGRMMLHASSLEITTPPSTRRVFRSGVPDEFQVI
jgi:23S rRNA pseudouridine1911/1915/1917 synthase